VYYLIKQDHGEQNGDRTFEASCSPFEPHLLTQEDLNDLSVILNPLKKPAELLVFRLNGWNILHYDTEIYFFSLAKMNSKNFSLKK